jgi:hypothetical protein
MNKQKTLSHALLVSNEIGAGIPPKNSMLLLSAYRAARLRLPNMAQEPRNAVGMILCPTERCGEREKTIRRHIIEMFKNRDSFIYIYSES